MVGALTRPAVEAILISASGALLSDSRAVDLALAGKKRYKTAQEQWNLLAGRILGAYDKILDYFERENPDLLEEAFEVISVSLLEQRKLLLHLPQSLQTSDSLEIRSFLDFDPEAQYEVFLEGLETLLNRREIGPLERRLGQWISALESDDSVIQEDLDEVERALYAEQAQALITSLRRLTSEKARVDSLFEKIEELIEERVAVQTELLS